MSTGSSLPHEDSSCSNSISSPECHPWSPSADDDAVFIQPASPTLPVITVEAQIQQPRIVKDVTNKKERRRTQSINTAFSDLRCCIPNVPTDTKLSKIKTLRLAISYIQYLMQQLNDDRYSMVIPDQRSFHDQNSFYQFTRRGMTEQLFVARGLKRGYPAKVSHIPFSSITSVVFCFFRLSFN